MSITNTMDKEVSINQLEKNKFNKDVETFIDRFIDNSKESDASVKCSRTTASILPPPPMMAPPPITSTTAAKQRQSVYRQNQSIKLNHSRESDKESADSNEQMPPVLALRAANILGKQALFDIKPKSIKEENRQY